MTTSANRAKMGSGEQSDCEKEHSTISHVDDTNTPGLTCSQPPTMPLTTTGNKPSPLSLLNSENQNVKVCHGESVMIKMPYHPETRDDNAHSTAVAVPVPENPTKRDTWMDMDTTPAAATSGEKANISKSGTAEGSNPTKNAPNYLDEDTLDRFKSYLKNSSGQCTELEYLDEDHIEKKMVETNRMVADQIKQQAHVSLCEDSDEDGEAPHRKLVRKQEENFVLARNFFKQTVSACQHQSSSGTSLDKRTMTWLGRAMGIRREKSALEALHGIKPLAEPQEDAEEQHEEDSVGREATAASAPMTKRRLTRSQARSTRLKRREERLARENQGLDALIGAVKDLEAEIGPMKTEQQPLKKTAAKPISTERRRRRQTRGSTNNHNHETNAVEEMGSRKSQRRVKKAKVPAGIPMGGFRKSQRQVKKAKAPAITMGGSTKRQRREGKSKGQLKALNGTVVHVKVGGTRIRGDVDESAAAVPVQNTQGGLVQNKYAGVVVAGGRPRRHIPLTDRDFLIWFQHVHSRERRRGKWRAC